MHFFLGPLVICLSAYVGIALGKIFIYLNNVLKGVGSFFSFAVILPIIVLSLIALVIGFILTFNGFFRIRPENGLITDTGMLSEADTIDYPKHHDQKEERDVLAETGLSEWNIGKKRSLKDEPSQEGEEEPEIKSYSEDDPEFGAIGEDCHASDGGDWGDDSDD